MSETMLFVTITILIASALLLACACGYMLGRNSKDLMLVQDVWEAAGGNCGIEATLEETLEALRKLDAYCNICHRYHSELPNAST